MLFDSLYTNRKGRISPFISNVIPESLSISEYQAFMGIGAVVWGEGGWGGEERNDNGRLIIYQAAVFNVY